MLRRNRLVGAAALAAAGTLFLGACGSDNNNGGGSGSSPSNGSTGSSSANAAGGITCARGLSDHHSSAAIWPSLRSYGLPASIQAASKSICASRPRITSGLCKSR